MDVAIFYQLPTWPEQRTAQRYNDTLDQIVLADELGFPVVWLAELHFEPRYGVMPSPFLMAAAVAQRTSTIRIGTAVTLLPLHDPLRVAEEAAMLDNLSGGRLEFGIGRGGFQQHYAGYNIPLNERQARFDEAYAVLIRAWNDEPLTFQGDFWSYRDVRVTPKPLQRPHPPLWMAANSDESVTTALSHDLRLMTAIMTAPPEQIAARARRYLAGRPGAVDGDHGMLVPIYVAEDDAQARADVEASYLSYFAIVGQIVRDGLQAGLSGSSNLPPLAQRFEAMTYEDAARDIAAVGSPATVAARLHQIYDHYHSGHIMGWFNFGGRIPHEKVLNSMRLFAQEVRPALQPPPADPRPPPAPPR